MKINEVEQLVGISKRNIRFYEKEGLLSPGRNADNGYRDYGEEDVETLRKIKLLRKLDVPLEEIRRMQQGELTLATACCATSSSWSGPRKTWEPCALSARSWPEQTNSSPTWTPAAGWQRWSVWSRRREPNS